MFQDISSLTLTLMSIGVIVLFHTTIFFIKKRNKRRYDKVMAEIRKRKLYHFKTNYNDEYRFEIGETNYYLWRTGVIKDTNEKTVPFNELFG